MWAHKPRGGPPRPATWPTPPTRPRALFPVDKYLVVKNRVTQPQLGNRVTHSQKIPVAKFRVNNICQFMRANSGVQKMTPPTSRRCGRRWCRSRCALPGAKVRLDAARVRTGISTQEHVRRAIDLYLSVIERGPRAAAIDDGPARGTYSLRTLGLVMKPWQGSRTSQKPSQPRLTPRPSGRWLPLAPVRRLVQAAVVTYESRIAIDEAWQYRRPCQSPGVRRSQLDRLRQPAPILRVPNPANELEPVICRVGIVRQRITLAEGIEPEEKLEVWKQADFERVFIPRVNPRAMTTT